MKFESLTVVNKISKVTETYNKVTCETFWHNREYVSICSSGIFVGDFALEAWDITGTKKYKFDIYGSIKEV